MRPEATVRKRLNLKIVVPILLSVSLIVFLLGFGDLSVVADRIGRLTAGTLAAVFGLAAVYLVLKLLQYRRLLGKLHIRPSSTQMALSFAIGEMSLSLPAGAYAQSFVLRHIHGAHVSRSAAAATFALGYEGAIALITLAVVGIPAWSWLRPALGIFFAVAAFVLVLLLGVPAVSRGLIWVVTADGWRKPGGWLLIVARSVRELATPRTLIPSALLAAGYMSCVVGSFLLIGRGVGLSDFRLEEATTVYFFGLAVVLLLGPASTQLGVIEASGLGAMFAWGYTRNEALAALLGFRLAWTASVWLICIPVTVFLRHELVAHEHKG
ncbi:MAG: hypothetical protein ACOX6T_28010 [Myxococcales bacterium]|jgi:hypothetical protein